MAIQYKDWTGAVSISNKISTHRGTFLYKWVMLAQPVLGEQLIPFVALCSAGSSAAGPYRPILFWGLWQVNLILGQQLLYELPAVPWWWGSSQTWRTTCRIRGSLSPVVLCADPHSSGFLRASNSSFTGLALGAAAQPRAERESAHSSDCCPIAAGSILGASTFVCNRRLLAKKMPGCRSFPGCRDPPRLSEVPWRCLPFSRPAEVGFGPPFSRMRTLLFALKTRPVQVTRWQQQTQEGPQMGFFAAGCTASSLSCSRNILSPRCQKVSCTSNPFT